MTAVDPIGKFVTSVAGVRRSYSKLIWACGGHARRLTCVGGDLSGVHTIRTRADADALEAELADAQRVVVIGAGFIGLEAAAVLRKLGKAVTVIEAQSRVLARVAAEPLSQFYRAEHESHGVEFLLETSIDALVGEDGRVTGVAPSRSRALFRGPSRQIAAKARIWRPSRSVVRLAEPR